MKITKRQEKEIKEVLSRVGLRNNNWISDIVNPAFEHIKQILKGGDNENMDNSNQSQVAVTNDDIHLLRRKIDAVIQEAQALQSGIGRDAGGREISLVVTKLQEGKMWAGKILEAKGSELPAQYADKA